MIDDFYFYNVYEIKIENLDSVLIKYIKKNLKEKSKFVLDNLKRAFNIISKFVFDNLKKTFNITFNLLIL